MWGYPRRVAWWSRDYLDAVRAMARSRFSSVAATTFGTGETGRAHVVLLPGVYEPWRFLLPLVRGLHGRGFAVHVVESLGNNRLDVPAGARIVRTALDEILAADPATQVVLVAHSKGGLVGKRVLLDLPSWPDQVLGLVAVATPFCGSVLARVTPGRVLGELRPNSSTIRGLANDRVNGRIVSILPAFDPHIPGERLLPGAQIRTLRGAGHFSVLTSAELLDEIAKAIDDLAQTRDD